MRTAYLKAHYPNEYMAAVLSSYMGNTDRLIRYISSCNHNGTPVLPPDINSSNAEFTPVENGIRFGLVGVRGVGRNVADEKRSSRAVRSIRRGTRASSSCTSSRRRRFWKALRSARRTAIAAR